MIMAAVWSISRQSGNRFAAGNVTKQENQERGPTHVERAMLWCIGSNAGITLRRTAVPFNQPTTKKA
jgi:hypothetical protein